MGRVDSLLQYNQQFLVYNTYDYSLQVLRNEVSIATKVRRIWPADHNY